jgi:hypothetical protein
MLVRYLPVIFVLAALLLALAPIETAAQTAFGSGNSGPGDSRSGASAANPAQVQGKDDEQPRPKTAGAPVNTNADKKKVPPATDERQVRPAQAFPPERIAPSRPETPQAPSRGGVQTPDKPATTPAPKDDPRSVEEQPDPGG